MKKFLFLIVITSFLLTSCSTSRECTANDSSKKDFFARMGTKPFKQSKGAKRLDCNQPK